MLERQDTGELLLRSEGWLRVDPFLNQMGVLEHIWESKWWAFVAQKLQEAGQEGAGEEPLLRFLLLPSNWQRRSVCRFGSSSGEQGSGELSDGGASGRPGSTISALFFGASSRSPLDSASSASRQLSSGSRGPVLHSSSRSLSNTPSPNSSSKPQLSQTSSDSQQQGRNQQHTPPGPSPSPPAVMPPWNAGCRQEATQEKGKGLLGSWTTRQFRLMHVDEAAPPTSSRSQPTQGDAGTSSYGLAEGEKQPSWQQGAMRTVQSAEQLETMHACSTSGSDNSTKLNGAKASQQLPETPLPVTDQQRITLSPPCPVPGASAATAWQLPLAPAAAVNISREAGSDAETNAAWRWRFQRRWIAEQQRCRDPEEAGSLNDKVEDALAFLQAGGGAGWHMQVANARTTPASMHSGVFGSVGTLQGNGSILTGELLLDDGSYTAGSLLRGGGSRGHRNVDLMAATREVNSLNRRAVNLLQQQQELERAAEQRWRELASSAPEAWIGNLFETVEIDDWGVFKFLVIKLRGRSDRQRILVRGHNYATEGKLVEDLNRKMMQLSARHGLAAEPIEVMGGGVMEWRRDRDRHLHIHSGFISPSSVPGAGRPACTAELLNLAAVLTRQGLPPHYKVSIGNGRD